VGYTVLAIEEGLQPLGRSSFLGVAERILEMIPRERPQPGCHHV